MIGKTNAVIGGNSKKVIDLSMQDIYGNPTAQNTANCYVIKEAGIYKFPLVFGNAIKNGSINSAAFTKNSGSYSHDFKSAYGTIINSPSITEVASRPESVQLSLADTDDVIKNLEIIGGGNYGYVQFEVNYIPSTGANGIISVKSNSGSILWSWHIWVWGDDLTPIEITNATSNKYQILPVNLASKWDSKEKTHIKNWFYQFGRPTPLLCLSSYNSTTLHTNYGVLNYEVGGTATLINDGIVHPNIFYKTAANTNNNNWFSTDSAKTYNLWDAACVNAGCSDNNVVKTVYDPCPPGYKMPNGNVFTGASFIKTVNNIVYLARYSGDTTGFGVSLSRYLVYGNGTVATGDYGCVYTSAAYGTNAAYYMDLTASRVRPQDNTYRANGLSIRPVKE